MGVENYIAVSLAGCYGAKIELNDSLIYVSLSSTIFLEKNGYFYLGLTTEFRISAIMLNRARLSNLS